MSRRSKKISRLHKENKFLQYTLKRAEEEIKYRERAHAFLNSSIEESAKLQKHVDDERKNLLTPCIRQSINYI